MSSETPNGGERTPAIPPPAKKDPALNIALRGDRLYETNQLDKWFAISSLLLFVFTVWMVVDDYNREWRVYQRAFNRLSVEQTVLDIEAAAGAIDLNSFNALDAQRLEAGEQLAQNSAAVAEIGDRIDAICLPARGMTSSGTTTRKPSRTIPKTRNPWASGRTPRWPKSMRTNRKSNA